MMSFVANQTEGDAEGVGRQNAKRKVPPAKTLEECFKRLETYRSFHKTGTGTNRFNHVEFQVEAKRYCRETGLNEFHVESGNNRGLYSTPAHQEVIVEQVPPFKDCTYFRDPHDLRVFCVSHHTTKQRMIDAGFEHIDVSHIAGEPSRDALPKLSSGVTVETTTPQILAERRAPATLKLPTNNTYPRLCGMQPESTTAEQIEHAVEVKVYDESTKTIYSPYYLWDSDSRKAVGLKSNSSLSNYFKIYWFLSTNDEYKNRNSREVKDNITELKKKAGLAYRATRPQGTPDWQKMVKDIIENKKAGLAAEVD
jgi:hypothetical protein